MKLTINVPVNSSCFFSAVGAVVVGLLLAILGLAVLIANSTPAPLSLGILAVGFIEITCGILTLRKNRAAWAFLLSTNWTATLVALFASPRIGDAAGVSLAPALVPCALFLVIALAGTLTEVFSNQSS